MEIFKCPFCDKGFEKKRDRGSHQKFCGNNPKASANRELLQKKAKENGERRLHERKEFKQVCPKCSIEFSVIGTQSKFDKGRLKRFCSRKCSNSRSITEDTKEQIGKTLKANRRKCTSCGQAISSINSSDICSKCKRFTLNKTCFHCSSPLPNENKTGYCRACLDAVARDVKSRMGKDGYRTKVKKGTHKGWISRNIVSYPERFWIKVLDNNGIPYIKEKKVGKYFLDFVIKKKDVLIDLEIDGGQHLQEANKAHDKLRDAFLVNEGYLVYRIPWNSINSDKGKEDMKCKIDEFIQFYNEI